MRGRKRLSTSVCVWQGANKRGFTRCCKGFALRLGAVESASQQVQCIASWHPLPLLSHGPAPDARDAFLVQESVFHRAGKWVSPTEEVGFAEQGSGFRQARRPCVRFCVLMGVKLYLSRPYPRPPAGSEIEWQVTPDQIWMDYCFLGGDGCF